METISEIQIIYLVHNSYTFRLHYLGHQQTVYRITK